VIRFNQDKSQDYYKKRDVIRRRVMKDLTKSLGEKEKDKEPRKKN
jgi:hypothetical protein